MTDDLVKRLREYRIGKIQKQVGKALQSNVGEVKVIGHG